MINQIINWFENKVCMPPLGADGSPLLKFPNGADFTAKDSYSGIGAIGSIDSGKTSLAHTIRQSLLAHRYGLLVLCVKVEEADEWAKLADEMGRTHDFVRFTVGGRYRFNPFTGLDPVEVVSALEDIGSVFSPTTSISENSAFWKGEGRKLLRNAATLDFHANGSISLESLAKVINSFAKNSDQVESKSWQEKSACYQALMQAEQRSSGDHDVALAREFTLDTFPNYDPKTQGNVIAVVGNLLENLRREPFRSLFSGVSNISPEDILDRSKIVCVDIPVLDKRATGTIANAIWLFFFCRALTKRKTASPAALYIDEAQFLVSPELQMTQTVIRTHHVATILLFQNLSVLRKHLSEDEAKALLNTLNTMIFTRQADADTRQWAADRIGKVRRQRKTESQGRTHGHSGGASASESTEWVWEYKFEPSLFGLLKNGGKKYGYEVESIVHTGDKSFRASWHQTKPGRGGTVKPQY
jgi:type IV secretory pathway TraG/TraD family ATPase VirD4